MLGRLDQTYTHTSRRGAVSTVTRHLSAAPAGSPFFNHDYLAQDAGSKAPCHKTAMFGTSSLGMEIILWPGDHR